MNKMVNTATDVLIERVQFPDINDVEFGPKLRSAFETFNDNFARLANHDFIKGESGTFVYIKQEPIYNDSGLSTFGYNLKNYLESLINPTEKTLNSDGIMLDYFGNFTSENAGSLQVIYNKSNDISSDDIAVSSLQYVFLDGRFWNDKVGKVNQSVYDGIEDKSCIVVYDSTIEGELKFKSLNDAFPTMYYERGFGLCWKLNGKPTGMPIQGIPGKDGKNALMRIVKVNGIELDVDKNVSIGDVISIFEEKSGYIDITEDVDIDDYADSSALIISSEKIYIGLLGIKTYNDENGKPKDKLIAICDPAISLNETITGETIYNEFKKISLNTDSTSQLPGLFIPINTYDNELETSQSQSAHLISAAPIINTNDLEYSLPNSDILFTPVNDIDNIDPDPTENKPLNVDKYLYLKVDNEYLKLSSFSTSDNPTNFDDRLSNYNYCIKYKLVGIAKTKDDEFLKPDFSEEGGLCYVDDESSENYPIDNNVIYRVSTDDGYTYYTNYTDTLPNDLESNPFYVWEAQDKNASYDIDELKDVASKGVDPNPYADVPPKFKYICTRTITPGSSSKIYWFDVLDIEKENDTTYSIPGWHESSYIIFNFIKFVPVFKDEFYHVNDDTAVNFNYNVNITGCDHANSEVKRNLSVHGDINCDNINIDGVVASKEIDTIYTKNEIVGESGLKLCKDSPDNYQFSVDDGNVQAINVKAEYINADSISTKSFNSNDCIATDSFLLKSRISNKQQQLPGNSYTTTELVNFNSIKEIDPFVHSEVNASFNKVRTFDIVGNGHSFGSKSYSNNDQSLDITKISKLNISEMPAIFTNNGNIIVTNENKHSLNSYHYGVPKAGKESFIENFSTENITFDNSKKFSMNSILKDENETFELASKEAEKIYRQTTYSHKNNISERSFGATKDYKYTFTLDNVIELSKEETNDTNKEKHLDNKSIEKFILNINGENEQLDKFENIKFDLRNKYIFHIGLYGKNSHASWPYIASDSYMNLKLYYKIGENNIIESDISYKYYFDGTGKDFEFGTTYGYKENGILETSWEYANRHRAYTFIPNSYKLSFDENEHSKSIYNALLNKLSVTFWIYPEFYIHTKSSQNKINLSFEVIKGIKIYYPKQISSVPEFNYTSTLNTDSAIQSQYSINYLNNSFPDKFSNSIMFYGLKITGENIVQNLTIHNDGVIIRNNKQLLGLGYTTDGYINHSSYDKTGNYWGETNEMENEGNATPVIFYYNQQPTDGKTGESLSSADVAKKMMVIPIKDIFTAIKILKTKFPGDWETAKGSNIY